MRCKAAFLGGLAFFLGRKRTRETVEFLGILLAEKKRRTVSFLFLFNGTSHSTHLNFGIDLVFFAEKDTSPVESFEVALVWLS